MQIPGVVVECRSLGHQRLDCLSDHGPVPVRLMLWGLVGSLPTPTAIVALSAEPPPVGVNFTATVHDECAATAAPQVPPTTEKSAAFAPLKLALSGSENPTDWSLLR